MNSPRHPPSRLGYSPALDGIRGVAILAVVGYHAFVFPAGGFLGVQVFFVLSGFLITVLLVQERERSGKISLRSFYRRRALRLVPALITTVAAYLLISAVRFAFGDRHAAGGLRDAAQGGLVGLLYISNAVIAWHGALPSGIQHLWSLAAEEQFYIVWPLTLVLAMHLRTSVRFLFGIAGAAVIFIDLHRLQLTLAGAPERRLFSAPDTTADAILVGCFLGLLYCSGALERWVQTHVWRRAVLPAAVLVLAGLLVLVPNPDSRLLYEALLPLVALSAAVIVGSAACDPGSVVTRFLSRRTIVGVGGISYGLYLWHPVLLYGFGVWLPLPAVLASLAVARLSYVLVERPFLERRRAVAAKHDRLDLRPTMTPVVAA